MHATNSGIRNRTFPGTESFCQYNSLSINFLKFIILAILITTLLACGRGKGNGGGGTEPGFRLSNDAYSTFGNTALEVGVPPGATIAVRIAGSVLDNDTAEAGVSLTVTSVTPGTGSVVMNADGSFDYSPAAGLLGVDTFSYEVSDGTDTASADVTITLDNRVWYIDNTSAGTEGTSVDPFSTLLQAEGVAQPGDTIYIAYGDGSTSGLDNGLTLAVDNVTVIGEGADLVVDSITLASAGSTPTLTNTSGSGITLNSANNTLIMGLNIDGVTKDGLEVINSTGVILETITISNSGESAIQGSGADVDLILTDVIIDSVDVVDPSVSDDAIFIAPTSSASLVMSGGSISGVPGNLGDGIEFENSSSSNVVSMDLDIRGVNFSNITQDGIKLDNDNGVINAQIGGPTLTEGNELDVGFRGIQIQTDADPTLTRTNSIMIQNNTITSANESIQIRSIQDSTHLSILDNVVNRAVPASVSDLIDVQAELNSNTQARINRNDISNLGGSDGIRLRVLDQASLTMEALNNAIDAPDEGFDFDVIETDVTVLEQTVLSSTILTNTLSSLGSVAMNVTNVSSTSKTCLDLRGNSPVADYEVDATNGSFELTTVSQTIVLIGGSLSTPASDTCPVPTF